MKKKYALNLSEIKVDSMRNKLRWHKQKCQKMFYDIANGCDIYFFIERTDSKKDKYIEATIISDEILSYDKEILDKGRYNNADDRLKLLFSYRPYFVRFIIDLEDEDFPYLEGKWYKAKVLKNNLQCGKNIITGFLETTASPVNYIKKKIMIYEDEKLSEEILNEINNTYEIKTSCKNRQNIEYFMKNNFNFQNIDYIDFYNIGHGNADYIRGKKMRILYDIGYNWRQFPPMQIMESTNFYKALSAFRVLKPDFVILSHWDLDHIIGCAYCNYNLYNIPWIAPSIESDVKSKNARRLAKYLDCLDMLWLVDRKSDDKHIASIEGYNGVFNLWLGKYTSKEKNINRRNQEGLIIEIKHFKSSLYGHILLTGDVPYSSLPDEMNLDDIDLIHVPHHCSKMEIEKLKLLSNDNKEGLAIISTNRQKDTRLNYFKQHYELLKEKYKDITFTLGCEDCHNDDNENIRIEVDLNNSRVKTVVDSDKDNT